MVYPDFEIRRSILVGDTAEAYLQRTLTILRTENINPVVTVEFSPESEGIFSGLAEARSLLSRILPETGSEVWAVSDGDAVDAPGGRVASQGALRVYRAVRDCAVRHTGFLHGMGNRRQGLRGRCGWDSRHLAGRAGPAPQCGRQYGLFRRGGRLCLLRHGTRRQAGGGHAGGKHGPRSAHFDGRYGQGDGVFRQASAAGGAAHRPGRQLQGRGRGGARRRPVTT